MIKKNNLNKDKQGFTLAETLITLSILGIVAAHRTAMT
ncbi:prepilin-type N-terminal cleavage/methylation domain-containing protein [bacterium]|nr:prepilin-type N-terminal cleavage/methylation domain-containing protein [bacterium]